MIEIRLHGRGGQGVVKASQIIVKAAVNSGMQGQFIPFFGVERKGSPVYGYLRLSDKEIRRKTQIYEPDMVMIFDDSLIDLPETFEGLKKGGKVLINSRKGIDELNIPENASEVVAVDASGISERILGRILPNTSLLGAFTNMIGFVDKNEVLNSVEEVFGNDNRKAAEVALREIKYLKGGTDNAR